MEAQIDAASYQFITPDSVDPNTQQYYNSGHLDDSQNYPIEGNFEKGETEDSTKPSEDSNDDVKDVEMVTDEEDLSEEMINRVLSVLSDKTIGNLGRNQLPLVASRLEVLNMELTETLRQSEEDEAKANVQIAQSQRKVDDAEQKLKEAKEEFVSSGKLADRMVEKRIAAKKAREQNTIHLQLVESERQRRIERAAQVTHNSQSTFLSTEDQIRFYAELLRNIPQEMRQKVVQLSEDVPTVTAEDSSPTVQVNNAAISSPEAKI